MELSEEKTTFIKFYPGKDYPEGPVSSFAKPALTLNAEYVIDVNPKNKKQPKEFTNDSGWTIKGEIKLDWHEWVNKFEAHHPDYGVLKGDFEKWIEAESKEAFDHFWEHHQPTAWDYWDA